MVTLSEILSPLKIVVSPCVSSPPDFDWCDRCKLPIKDCPNGREIDLYGRERIMKKVGIVIDSWKYWIFKRILDANGYKFEEDNTSARFTVLTIETEDAGKLQPFIDQAYEEAARSKH